MGFVDVAGLRFASPLAPVLINRLRKFTVLAFRHKLVIAQAWFMLGWYRGATLVVPFKRLTDCLQHHPVGLSPPALAQEQREEAVMIGRLVAAASHLAPWHCPCLSQVLVVQRLLAKRNIPGQLYLGVRRNGETAREPNGLSGHAWLQCGSDIVSGASGHEQFTVVSAFSWDMASD